MSTHDAFREVGSVESLTVMIAFHSAAGSFDVFAIGHQHIVNFGVIIGNAFPVVKNCSPVEESSDSEHSGERIHPVSSFPVNIADRVLHKSEEVLESSSFVALVIRLFTQSVLFQFPIILLSHGSELRSKLPVDRLESLSGIGCAIVQVEISVISFLDTMYLTLSPSSTGAFLIQR